MKDKLVLLIENPEKQKELQELLSLVNLYTIDRDRHPHYVYFDMIPTLSPIHYTTASFGLSDATLTSFEQIKQLIIKRYLIEL